MSGAAPPASSAVPEQPTTGPVMSHGVLVLLVSTALLVSFSESMLIPALPTIQAQYGASASAVSWVPAIYLLVGAVSVPLMGKLGDTRGKKRMLIFVMIAYSAAVILDGFSWDLYSLLAFRAVQGLGLAMFPLAIALVSDELAPQRVPVAVGMITAMNGVGAAIGLVLGAAITEHFGWQTNYHLLAPFAVGLTVALFFLAKESTRLAKERIDYVGISLLGLTVTLFLVAISEGGSLGWTSVATLALFGLGVLFAVVLVVVERRVAEPLIAVKAPEIGDLMKVDFAMLLAGASMFMAFYLAIYFAQEPGVGLGRNVEQAGLILTPAAVGMLLFAPLGARIAQRTGPKLVALVGALLTMVGFTSFFFLYHTGAELAVAAVVVMAGVSFMLTSLAVSILLLAPPEKVGTEVGLNTSFRTIGQAVGVAVAGAFLASFVIPGTVLPSDTAYEYTAIAGIVLGGVAVGIIALLPHLRLKGPVPAAVG
jgi:MFS family permease